MEKMFAKLFDYQRFEKNAGIEKMIAESESRFAEALSDDALASVSAAGECALPMTGAQNGAGDDPAGNGEKPAQGKF